jgi:hypothetical protein
MARKKSFHETYDQSEIEHRRELWEGYYKFATNLRRRGELDAFQTDLQGGRCGNFERAELLYAAVMLVLGLAAAGAWPLSGLPAPSDADLREPDWIERRVAQAQAEQKVADRQKRWRAKLARATGKPSGQTNPVHLQKSKYSLDELTRRLESTIARHEAERGKFERRWLDHRSPFYIRDSDGGISNKGIILMANAITGKQERRDYDQNWQIVMDWLRDGSVRDSDPAELQQS